MPRRATLLTPTARTLLCACGLAFAVALAAAQQTQRTATRLSDALAETYAAAGRLPLTYISPDETGLDPSNWALAEDPNGLLYVGNSEGLLVYDGVRWRSVSALEGEFIRSLDVGPDGTVYVGAVGDFGRLRPGLGGVLTYESFTPPAADLPDGVTDVWVTEAYAEGIAFHTEAALFLWRDDALTTIPLRADLHVARVYEVGGALVAVIESEGGRPYLAEVEPGVAASAWERLPFSWDGSWPYALLEAPGGGTLLVTETSGLWYCTDVTPDCLRRSTPTLDTLLAANYLYAATQHPSGVVALGFDGGGIALVTPDGRVLRHLTEAEGLENGEVMHLATDHTGTLWAALYNGIARVDVSARLTHFGRTEGIPSQVNTVVWHDEVLWATTMLGTRYRPRVTDAEAAAPRFVAPPDADVYGNCFDQVVWGGAHYLACRMGIAEVVEGAMTLALAPEPLGVFNGSLAASVHAPSALYASRDKDIVALYQRDGTLEAGRVLARMRDVMASIVEEPERDADGRIVAWAYSALEGLCRIAWLPSSADAEAPPPRVRCLAAEEIPAEIDDLVWLDGALRALSRDGPLRLAWRGDAFVVLPDTALARLAPSPRSGVRQVKDGPDGIRWVVTEDAVTPWHRSEAGGYVAARAHALQFSRASAPVGVAADPGAEDVVWIATRAGVVRYHYAAAPAPPASPPRTLIRAVLAADTDSVYFAGHPPSAAAREALTLHFAERSVRFQYAAPGLGGAFGEGVTYRHRLLGEGDEAWSDWTDAAEQAYPRLSPGPYVFEVEARDPMGREAAMGRYTFRIRAPWYRSTLALVAWTVLGLGLLFGMLEGINRIRTRRIKAYAQRLAEQVAERTGELNAANDELRGSNLRLHELNQQLGARTEDLQEALGRNEELLGITAHDLRNPLTGIHGLAEALTEDAADDLDPEHADLLAVIRDEAKRMLGLIEEVLEQHRDEARTDPFAPLHRERADLTEMVRHTLQWNASNAEAKRITLRLETDRAVWAEVDPAAIQRVTDNLVSNAIKYSPPGTTVRAYVEALGASDGPPCARLTVRDEGPGLTDTDKRRAFRRGQRLSAKPTAGEASTGLGLYIVKRVVEGHGGKVGVESTPGAGAAFWIVLPCEADERVPSGSFGGDLGMAPAGPA